MQAEHDLLMQDTGTWWIPQLLQVGTMIEQREIAVGFDWAVLFYGKPLLLGRSNAIPSMIHGNYMFRFYLGVPQQMDFNQGILSFRGRNHP